MSSSLKLSFTRVAVSVCILDNARSSEPIFPLVPGFTRCQDESDNNSVSQLYQRIDLILTLGKVSVRNIALFGPNPRDRIIGGLWPSAQAGVVAHVVVERE